MTPDDKINDFAIRCFRDQGDDDYVSARMSFRSALVGPLLWSSLQMIEKYLKCILLLNRISSKKMFHNLAFGLDAIRRSGKLDVALTRKTRDFIEHIDAFGRFRYLEVSNVAYGANLLQLDRTAWELRRYCSLDEAPRRLELKHGLLPPTYRLPGGRLEGIVDSDSDRARRSLLWRNPFFGLRRRRKVGVDYWVKATNAPLYLNPEIFDEIERLVLLPKDLVREYQRYRKP